MTISNFIEKEKRDFIRFDVEAEVVFKIHGSDEVFTGNCMNLSYTGIRFVTSTLLKEGTKVDITANIDSGVFQPLKAKMIVKKVKNQAGGKYLVTGKMKEVK